MAARLLPEAPEDLTRGRLKRLGEGIGSVVYASEHWVVKRERRPSAVLALILIWRAFRALDRLLPVNIGGKLLARPSRRIRLLRIFVEAVLLIVPRTVWLATHTGRMWRTYRMRDREGRGLAAVHLGGTSLVPEQVEFPPTRVRVGGWPGWLVVSEATERVETTLYDRINELARAHRFDEVERWLERFLELRQAGWRRGVFSLDAHLKNYGVTGDRVVLIDTGGLTNRWADVERHLEIEDAIDEPHTRLGLENTLRDRPDIAQRFDSRWRTMLKAEAVERHWNMQSQDLCWQPPSC